jgi:two-component system chemotaxis sensor kinase CheA
VQGGEPRDRGADVELDREMIELRRDPLVHIIRNSIDHGIETPAAVAWRESPKPAVSSFRRVRRATRYLSRSSDDERGIDVARIVAKAVEKGLYNQAELTAMSEASQLELIFAPGLLSRDVFTATSAVA